MAIAGMIFVIAGGVLWWVQNRQQNRCRQLKLARACQVSDLETTATAVSKYHHAENLRGHDQER